MEALVLALVLAASKEARAILACGLGQKPLLGLGHAVQAHAVKAQVQGWQSLLAAPRAKAVKRAEAREAQERVPRAQMTTDMWCDKGCAMP
mmetsp:Transcript_30112/g.64100  ORF Transcript_30112/g.64100 Transcript_30112/m.64100 type:complete len:91 (-) Transcript_30112:95-367(-)